MRKKIFICMLLLVTFRGLSQADSTVALLRGRLQHLKYQKRFSPKYVNFDVLKLMLGRGQALAGGNKYGPGLSLNIQVLNPWPFFKTTFPITIGLTTGYQKMSLRHSKLIFTNNRLIEIQADNNIQSSMQKTGYFGIIILRAVRYSAYTFLFGTSMNYNFGGRLRSIDHGKRTRLHDNTCLNRVSLPLHFQMSYSPRQLWSAGIFCSYDTRARFKGDDLPKLKQFTTGLSVGVIL